MAIESYGILSLVSANRSFLNKKRGIGVAMLRFLCSCGSELDHHGFMGEGRDGRGSVFEIIDGGVAVGAGRVHRAKRGVFVKHALLRLGALVEDERARQADPFAALHGAEFYFGVRGDLFCNGFAFARLDIQLALKDVHGAERPHARLVALDGRKIVRLGCLQKFINAVHGVSSSVFSLLYHARSVKASCRF